MNRKSAERMAKALALTCMRVGFLEELHSGKSARSETGDYSDIKVITPKRDIAWNDLSRFNDDEMKHLMQSVVDRLYTVFLNIGDPEFMAALMAWGDRHTAQWDKPKALSNFVIPNRKPAKKLPVKRPTNN